MKHLIFLFMIMVANSSRAHINQMYCDVIDGDQKQVDSLHFYSGRGSKDFQISQENGHVLSFNWRYQGDNLEVYLLRNRHYPFSIPFTIRTLDKQKLRRNDHGVIEGSVTLNDSDSAIYTVTCKEE
jgi:hypothetical protein